MNWKLFAMGLLVPVVYSTGVMILAPEWWASLTLVGMASAPLFWFVYDKVSRC